MAANQSGGGLSYGLAIIFPGDQQGGDFELDLSLVPEMPQRIEPRSHFPLCRPWASAPDSSCKAEPTLDLGSVQVERFGHEPGRNTFGSHLDHFVKLMFGQAEPVVPDFLYPRAGGEQMHQKFLGFDGIIGEVGENPRGMAGHADIIDGEFFKHNEPGLMV